MDVNRIKHLAGVKVNGVQDDNLLDAIVALYLKQDKVSESDMNKLAKQANITIDQFYGVLDQFFRNLIRGVGKHAQVPDEHFDKHELEMGVKVEKEHTSDPYIAKIIAKDHLMELPDYYTRLQRMEKGGGK